MKYRIVSTNIYGVKLFAVESEGGYVVKYCDTREDAETCIAKIEDDDE